ncbi:LysR substrate-binding domain-containing protein [Pendulispora rubella]|uniref:LysR substrate-binding domain-containing protein n=1 Tax=Pendulispora rubella TaxID=2741070 RepID=A0ABZ2L9E9_9BACT
MNARPELPSLHALHCFDVASRSANFTEAARTLHLTHGAISRQIRALETALGVRLFVRGARNVALTADGTALMQVTERAFGILHEGVAQMQRRHERPLVLSCEPTLALQWLIPRLASFYEAHPEQVVHIESSGGPIDFARTGVDLAIRRQDFPIAPGLACEPLMDEWLGPVCSPTYAKKLRGKHGLDAVTLLHTRTRPHAFRDWAKAASLRLRPKRQLTFDHFSLSLQSATAGLGLAIGPSPLVADALQTGQLVAPFGFVRGDVGYVLLGPSHGETDPRLHVLRDWLMAQAKGVVLSKSSRFNVPSTG